MKFDWNAVKADVVWQIRKIDFADMTQIFANPHIVSESDQNGERRWKATGRVENTFYTVVYTMRDDVCWIITARRAWKSEERAYLQAQL